MSRGVVIAGALVGVAVILLGVSAYLYEFLQHSVEGWDRYVPLSEEEGPAEAAAKAAFLSDTEPAGARYGALFRYFAAGVARYVSPLGAHIHYRGAGSSNGYNATGLEGFARTGSLLAAWVASGHRDVEIGGRRLDLVEFLRNGIVTGTDPGSAEYWGAIRDRGQGIFEAADIARILWMTREEIWDRLAEDRKAQVAGWLLQVEGVVTNDNNMLLQPVTVALVMKALGWHVEADGAGRYEQFKRHYLSNGWFYDEPGVVDYYNTWGMTYELFWITSIDARFDRDFIHQAIRDSAWLTAHLIGPRGFPIMGRSICYRTAVPVPLIAQALLEPDPASGGLARRATDAVWRYFVAKGVLQDGGLTQGYYRSEFKILDSYSGPGSCHWGLRSLVLAFLAPAGSSFWTAPEQPLPVEVADYRLELDRLGWIVKGNKATGEISIEIPQNSGSDVALKPYGLWNEIYETLFQCPRRPGNTAAKYELRRYSSAKPFWAD